MCKCNGNCQEVNVSVNPSRGFEFVRNCPENKTSYLPQRSTKKSAGYDFRIPGNESDEYVLEPAQTLLIPTNIKAYMMEDEVLELHVRSSIGIKKGLVLKNGTGIVDSDYYGNPDNDGNIHIALLNLSHDRVVLHGGDKVIQGIFKKYLIADGDEANMERTGGTGSTGQ